MALESVRDYIIVDLENRKDVLHLPVKFSERIKYTCFAVSKNYVIFGATSGGLYVFKRNPFSFWQVIPSKESAITLICISSSENFVAFATNKNVICVLELNENSSGKPAMRTDDLNYANITVIIWDDDMHKPTLYIGDSEGRVSFFKLSFLHKNILHLPTTVLMSLDSRIVQLSSENEYLLASTMTRCYLCDTIKEQFKQIGQQLRDGYFGATFLSNGPNLKIFCARPGLRFWEVSLDSVVRSTHQFKHLLAIPPCPFISLFNEPKIVEVSNLDNEWPPQSFNFIRLFDLMGKYVVTYSKNGIYLLDVEEVSVLFWSNCFGDIADVRCVSNSIFVWNAAGDFHELLILPTKKCILSLYLKQYYSLCVELICRLYDRITEGNSLAELKPLCQLEFNDEDTEKMEILEKFKSVVQSKSIQNYELNCGIHIVNNKHFSAMMLDDSNLNRKPRSLQRTDLEEIRKRSRSLPSNLKKDPTEENSEVDGVNGINGSDYEDREYSQNNSYLETGSYNSPFLTLASYELLEDCLNELSEKFNESSKSVKEKWSLIENKLKFSRNTKSETTVTTVSFKDDHEEIISDDEIEPVVTSRKKSKVDTDYSKIIELCGRENVDTIEFVNLIVQEHKMLNEKHNLEQFPFSVPDPCFIRAKTLFSQFLTPEKVNQWFSDDNHSLCGNNFSEFYPSLFLEVYSSAELKKDFLLQKTLSIFSELINPTTILETIKSLKLPCYFSTFCFIIKYFQNSEVLGQNHYSKDNRAHWPLPLYLNTMMLMIGLDQDDVFCEMGLKKNVQALDIIYLLMFIDKAEKNTLKYINISLTYIQKQFESGLGFCIFDNQILTLAVKMFSLVNEKFDLCCVTCWFILPVSQPTNVKFIELAKCILEYLWNILISTFKDDVLFSKEELMDMRKSISDTTEYEEYSNYCYKNMANCKHIICCELRSKILNERDSNEENKSLLLLLSLNIICSFCHRVPQLWEHLSTLQKRSPVKILHLEHFIQLGNVVEIESHNDDIDIERIRKIFHLTLKLSDGYCLNCNCKIPVNRETTSWDQLAMFALKTLGTKDCLKMLEEFSARIVLESSFYRAVLLTSIPGISSDFAKMVLPSISSISNIAVMSPEIADDFSNALKMDHQSYDFLSKMSNVHHWGMTVCLGGGNQAICYSCSLPLFSKYLIKEDNGGVMVFSCSHTYHTICLKNKNCNAACLVCDRFLR